jgi:CRISPR-associated endoribonuclease Cas6
MTKGNYMRLHFELSPNIQPVPFDYQHFLTGAFHKWLGNNELHDSLSLYSLSWLLGGKRVGDKLTFPNGASWFISAHDSEVLHSICLNVRNEPAVCCGMDVIGIKILAEPDVQDKHVFKVASPVLARSREVEGRVKHFIYSDAEVDEVLTQTLRHKLDKAGLNEIAPETSVRFDRSYRSAQTKLVKINGISNRASICPVIVEGPPEAVQFAWNVGIGHLTGSGFGALV